ncbi:hypothetical protein TNCV_1309411 [Trichonephila clavipes]|nr:hypothetical protein TNCV_1309411 [Trichonephila clavipes]
MPPGAMTSSAPPTLRHWYDKDVIFEKSYASPHVAYSILIYCVTEKVQFLPWPARSPDLSSTYWSLDAVRLGRDHSLTTTVDKMRRRHEETWNSFSVFAIQA